MKLAVAMSLFVVTLMACSESPAAPKRAIDASPLSELTMSTLGCPEEFSLVSWKTGEDPDRNGDGAACQNVVYVPDQKPLFTNIDNNIPANHVGGCPRNFTRQYYVLTEEGFDPRDRNQNGQLCSMEAPSGQRVTIDDNVDNG